MSLDATGNEVLRIELRDAVMVMTLARPDARNALNTELAVALGEAFAQLDQDGHLRAGVLTGEGGFSAGLDLKAFLSEGLPPELLQVFERGSAKPLVAAVEGYALAGGLELALTCDLIIAGEGARFGIPEVGVGLFAGGGGLFRLRQRIGLTHTLELGLTGQPVDAERAAELGLISSVVPKGEALSAAIEIAERIAQNAPLATQATKQVVWDSIGWPDDVAWRRQEAVLADILASADAVEGPAAFAEKRQPNWTGN